MGWLDRMLAPFRPRRMDDPEFGSLLYMHVRRDPSKSYWEGEWVFPPTGTRIFVGLPGGEAGPTSEGRAFYLGLPSRFDAILSAARPRLDEVFRSWLQRPLGEDLWSDVQLAGFGVEDPNATPLEWDVAFETTGKKWLGVTVPFIGAVAQEPVVDT